MPAPAGPPPARLPDGGTAITVDVTEVRGKVVFDAGAQVATVSAVLRFGVDGPGGRPALDLRQTVGALRLDGRLLSGDPFPHLDLGGGPGAAMRVLEAEVEAGSAHTLELDYVLDTPASGGALPIGWGQGGVRWDLWMSDLHPGRYLEMWLPAPLCHDRFALSLDIEVRGTDRPHVVVTNGEVIGLAAGWRVTFPAHFTCLSPMLVVAPSDEVEQRDTLVALPGRAAPLALRSTRHRDAEVDLAACEADAAAWLSYLAARYGPWAHGDAMTVLVWASGRGMEYDGATTSAVGALEHEVFHSWFGRGVKPARAADGWIDEAYTSWATSTRRSEGPRYDAEVLGLDHDPVELCPPHPWARHTPVASYAGGARLFSGVAHLLGGAPQLRSAMGAWYRANIGGLATTDGLEAHLRSCGADVSAVWERYVHGRG